MQAPHQGMHQAGKQENVEAGILETQFYPEEKAKDVDSAPGPV